MILKDQLLTVGDAFAQAAGLSRSRISTIVLNRGSTLDSIAAGRADVTTNTFEKAMLWFSANWPLDLDWPADVPRPDPIPLDGEHPSAGESGPAVTPPAAGPGTITHEAAS